MQIDSCVDQQGISKRLLPRDKRIDKVEITILLLSIFSCSQSQQKRDTLNVILSQAKKNHNPNNNTEISETLGLDDFPGLGIGIGLENTHFPGLGLSLEYS